MRQLQDVIHSGRQEWRRPDLRRLPIAATAESSKGGDNANDGEGGGKGDLRRIS
jgi:hypothetical protein